MSTFPEFRSFDDVRHLIAELIGSDTQAAAQAQTRQGELTKPPGSLGRLEEIAIFMAAWQGTPRPVIDTAQAIVFAGNHGVCAQGVNPFPQEVTMQMVGNFQAGGAAINQLCAVADANLTVVPLNLETPTQDITTTAAMSETECMDAMNAGAAAVNASASILILGEMGIGNSTISAALAHGCFGGQAQDWVGRGTGSDAEGMSLKAKIITAAVTRHQPVDLLEKLAALGGREQAAICGAILRARQASIPVILDGYICTAAASPLFAFAPVTLDHCLVAHQSAEPGHAKLLNEMQKDPLLDLGMALGEGSGAAVALMVVRAALACHNGMATFAEAAVSDG